MSRIRRALASAGLWAAAAAAVIGGPAAVEAPSAAAQAAGSVANSCAVAANVEAHVKAGSKSWSGYYVNYLGCGQGMSNVWRFTVRNYPFYVKRPGHAPFCMNPGQWFYPQTSGIGNETVVTPTVRC